MSIPKPLRLLLAVVYGAYLLLSITAGLFCTVLPMYLILRPFSEAFYLNMSAHFQSSYLTVFPFVLEKLLGIRIRLTGMLPVKEPVLVLSNHLSHEWTVMYGLGYRSGVLGLVRTVIKDVIQYVPGFGWGMWVLYWPFVSRDFSKDEAKLKSFAGSYERAKLPVQLWLYPEGTRQTKSKLLSSQQYAKQKGYPVWNHIMLPRHRGFVVTVNALASLVRTILSVTVQYEGWRKAPSVVQLFSTDPTRPHVIHVHVKSYATAALPADDEGKRQWLMDCFAEKDKLLTEFQATGKFPGSVVKTEVSGLVMFLHVVAWGVLTWFFWTAFVRLF